MEQKNSPHALTELEQKFLRAAHNGEIEIVKDCISKQVDINVENKNGETALFLACYWGRIGVAIHLLQQKNIEANTISKSAMSHRTPLHYACSQNSPNRLTDIQQTRLISGLIAAGAHLDAQNIYHETPLHCALKLPFSEPVELLVASGASMIPRPNGLTPLQEADKEQNIGHVRALLKSHKITLEDVNDALRFNRNSRLDLFNDLRLKLGRCYKYTDDQFTHNHLGRLLEIINIPIEHCLSNKTIALFNEQYGSLQSFLQKSNIKNPMQEIQSHQDIYRVLFQYYRTHRMLDLAKTPKTKHISRLAEIPSDILKIMPALAAQPDLLSKDDVEKITSPKLPTL